MCGVKDGATERCMWHDVWYRLLIEDNYGEKIMEDG